MNGLRAVPVYPVYPCPSVPNDDQRTKDTIWRKSLSSYNLVYAINRRYQYKHAT